MGNVVKRYGKGKDDKFIPLTNSILLKMYLPSPLVGLIVEYDTCHQEPIVIRCHSSGSECYDNAFPLTGAPIGRCFSNCINFNWVTEPQTIKHNDLVITFSEDSCSHSGKVGEVCYVSKLYEREFKGLTDRWPYPPKGKYSFCYAYDTVYAIGEKVYKLNNLKWKFPKEWLPVAGFPPGFGIGAASIYVPERGVICVVDGYVMYMFDGANWKVAEGRLNTEGMCRGLALVGAKLMAVGNTCELYDFEQKRWTVAASLGVKRSYINLMIINGQIVCYGTYRSTDTVIIHERGRTIGSFSRVEPTEIYDPVMNVWNISPILTEHFNGSKFGWVHDVC